MVKSRSAGKSGCRRVFLFLGSAFLGGPLAFLSSCDVAVWGEPTPSAIAQTSPRNRGGLQPAPIERQRRDLHDDDGRGRMALKKGAAWVSLIEGSTLSKACPRLRRACHRARNPPGTTASVISWARGVACDVAAAGSSWMLVSSRPQASGVPKACARCRDTSRPRSRTPRHVRQGGEAEARRWRRRRRRPRWCRHRPGVVPGLERGLHRSPRTFCSSSTFCGAQENVVGSDAETMMDSRVR